MNDTSIRNSSVSLPTLKISLDCIANARQWTNPFQVVVIPEGGTENNSLASYDSKEAAIRYVFLGPVLTSNFRLFQ